MGKQEAAIATGKEHLCLREAIRKVSGSKDCVMVADKETGLDKSAGYL